MASRTLAWMNLAYRFGLHVLVQMPARALRTGADVRRFRDAVLPEGYVPLEPDERALMPETMRCVHCGLCALACSTTTTDPMSAWDEAWTFVAGPSRSLDRAPVVAFDMTPCADSAEGAAVCPTGVPIPRMATLVRRLAATALAAAPASAEPAATTATDAHGGPAAPATSSTPTPGSPA